MVVAAVLAVVGDVHDIRCEHRLTQSGQRGGGQSRGSDLSYDMEISLTDAYTGKSAQIRVPTSVSCETCSGSGAKPGTSPKTCGTCNGAGAVRSTVKKPDDERTALMASV